MSMSSPSSSSSTANPPALLPSPSLPFPSSHPLWIPANPPPPALIPPFETEAQQRSHRFALRLALTVLALNVANCFLAGFDEGWELPRWTAMASAGLYAPFAVSRVRRSERQARRKNQESGEALDAELGGPLEEEDKVLGA